MKKSKSLTNHSGFKGLVIMAVLAVIGVSSCEPDYILDKQFPSWLGTSIYETLSKGFDGEDGQHYTFKYYVRLIDSLNQKEVLAKTGSKTLFVADDAAFERFFGPNCPFKNGGKPVESFDELTKAQMTMILNGSMLNNVYQVAALSTSGGGENSDPTKGEVMRRLSASSIYDTIPVLLPSQMPKPAKDGNDFWKFHRTKGTGIPILQDGTIRPIVFFVPKFLTAKKMEPADYDFLFNQGIYDKSGKKPGRNETDASVNGVRIKMQNKKCFNGFIHVMEDVIYLLPNMAEYLEASDNATIYSRIIDRFAAPVYKESTSTTIKNLIGQGELKDKGLINAMNAYNDSVYIKRYFSVSNQDYSSREVPYDVIPNSGGKLFGLPHELLKFDPGWNGFFTPSASSDESSTALMQRNMAVMLVPTDATMMNWWLKGAGSTIRERYGIAKYKNRGADDAWEAWEVAEDMDSVDIKVIVKLLNNNMLSSLVGSVPSKFSSVLNDANDPMFEDPAAAVASVDSVVMCCNGAIYFTHAVYAPTAYRSVSYPALVNERLEIINTAIENKSMAFSAYLNSMSVPCYSFFVPVVRSEAGILNNKLLWVDPVSFPLAQLGNNMQAVVFSFDKEAKTIKAQWYNYNYATGTISGNALKTLTYKAPKTTNEEMDADSKIIMNRLTDLLNYHIIIGDIEAANSQTDLYDYRYFPTKGRGTVRFKTVADPEHDYANMEVDGGWQIETGEKVNIIQRFDFARGTSTNGNGRTYLIDRPLQTSLLSVYDILSNKAEYPEFSLFFDLMMDAQGRTVDIKDPKNASKILYKADNKPMFATNSNSHAIGAERCVSTLNSYHYTLYVPSNDSIQDLIDKGYLYTEASLKKIQADLDSIKLEIETFYGANQGDLAAKDFKDTLIVFHKKLRGVAATAPSTHADSVFDYVMFVEAMRERLKNFVKYHIQDNAVYANAEFKVGKLDNGQDAPDASYETAFMDRDGQFTKLTVAGGRNVTVTDGMGNTRHVVKAYSGGDPANAPLWNIMCREYEYDKATIASTSAVSGASIETSSYVVIHQIDGPLMHESFTEEQ